MAGTWQESAASKSNPDEARVKFAALDSFSKYRRVTHYNTTHRRRQNLYALPQSHWTLLASTLSLQAKLNRIDDAIATNGTIADAIAAHALDAFGISASDAWKDTAKPNDHDKARSTIRQLYRDWSAEGAVERDACYGPVLRDLENLFPERSARDGVKVLVPGAGLGRFLVEAVGLGFEAEGNELSFHQMMASNWLLNGVQPGEQFTLYPWALSFSNQRSVEAQCRSVVVPDVHPAEVLEERSEGMERHAFERMSMSAGDFCLLYTQEEYRATFGVVASVYFIDTAPNLIRYIEAISNVLLDGGYWINLGPLLWHFESRGIGGDVENDQAAVGDHTSEAVNIAGLNSKGIADPGSVELTAEEVLTLVSHFGFEVVQHEIVDQGQGYIQDTSSMMGTSYKVLHFVARYRRKYNGEI